MKKIQTDPFSQAPLYTKLKIKDQELGHATAFFYKSEDQLYLVSNWHTFAGRNPITNEVLSTTAGVPDSVSCYACLNGEFVRRQWLDLTLADSDQAFWYEHPKYRGGIDIGILPVDLPDDFIAIAINKLPMTDMELRVSHDVFITGYPLGLVQSGGMPVWKRASVASEPGTSSPSFLVDTATRPGMSGSPVIHRYKGFYKHDTNTKTLSKNDWFGEGDSFVGVYSGRLGASELEAQLGIVWKAHLIPEIIAGRRIYAF